MKKLFCMLLATIMALALVACGETAAPSGSTAQPESSAQADQSQETDDTASAAETDASEKDLDDYHVKILDIETGLTDYEGNSMIGIIYEFTNNSEESAAAEWSVSTIVFQDGIELEHAYPTGEPEYYSNNSKEIKTGVTLTCEEYFSNTSDTSDVEVEISAFISWSSEKAEKTFTIAK